MFIQNIVLFLLILQYKACFQYICSVLIKGRSLSLLSTKTVHIYIYEDRFQ